MFYFQNAKSLLTKHKKYFLEASYLTYQTSKMEFLQKRLATLSRKQFPQKFPLYMKVLNKASSHFDESYSPQQLTPPPNLHI